MLSLGLLLLIKHKSLHFRVMRICIHVHSSWLCFCLSLESSYQMHPKSCTLLPTKKTPEQRDQSEVLSEPEDPLGAPTGIQEDSSAPVVAVSLVSLVSLW